MMSPYASPLTRLETPPIVGTAHEPPKTPLGLIGLDGDLNLTTRMLPKRLPSLSESASAPQLARNLFHDPPPGVVVAGVPENPYTQSAADSTRALSKRARMLEARLEEVSAQLVKERKGRKAKEERLLAQAEVVRQQTEQGYKERLHQMQEAMDKLEAKYKRGVAQYEKQLSGISAEMQSAVVKQQEAAKEMAKVSSSEDAKRQRQRHVEHLMQLAVRRMVKQKLALGWSTWRDKYRERQRRRRTLLASVNRMQRPKLVHSYRLWRHLWTKEQEMARVAAAAADGERAGQKAVMATYEAKRRQEEARAAAAKEQRVAQLTQMAVRRICKAGLARGFSGWVHTHKEAVRRRRVLQAAGAKLLRPKLVASYRTWSDGWRAAEAAEASRLAKMSAAEREQV